MAHADESTRRFRIHARHLDGHHARFVEEASFEAAAVAYLENTHFAAPPDADDVVRVIVHEVGTGHERCFELNMATGETTSCG